MTTTRKSIFYITSIVLLVSTCLLFSLMYAGFFLFEENVANLFCEAESPGFIKEFSNTWSNVGFMIVAIIVSYQLAFKTTDKENYFSKTTFYPILFCVAVALLGPGSMALHATSSDIGGQLDVLSMFLLSSFMFSYVIQRLFKLNQNKFILLYILCMILSILSIYFREVRLGFLNMGVVDLTFGLFAVGSGTIEFFYMWFHKISWKKGLAYMGFFILAFIIWQIDFKYCNPTQGFQFHAMWHLLDAVSVYFLFQYYYSEKI